jgi:hypothetical protein
MTFVIQLKRGTTAQWTSWQNAGASNRLRQGEIGLQYSGSNLIEMKVGNGTSTIANLPRIPLYWAQLQTPIVGSDENAAKVKVTALVDDLPQSRVTGLVSALSGKVNVDGSKVLSTNDYTTAEKNKLSGIQTGAQVNSVTSVAGRTGAVSLTSADVGLGSVNNTTDLNKPISTAVQTALNGKVNTATGMGLSSNDYTTAEKNKLATLTVAVKPDWNVASSNAAGILNKPDLANFNFTGTPTSTTPPTGNNTTRIATTQFVTTAISGKADTTTVNNSLALKANINSPIFTGNPEAPTQATGNNTTRIATTEFVTTATSGKADTTTVNSALALKADTTTVNNSLALKANLSSPIFTGNPEAPTQTAGNASARIATTQFVVTAISGKADTTTVNSALALKADTTTVNSALALKADLSSGRLNLNQVPTLIDGGTP